MTRSGDAPVAPGRNLYVYGVVPAEVTLDLSDAPAVEDGATVEIVRRGEVAALVSPVSDGVFSNAAGDDLGWLEAPVRAHEAVLERALAAGAVVPMRFATVLAGEDGLGAYLDEHGERLAATLRELEGKREWGVKAVADAQASPAHAVRGEEPAVSEGAAYLARKRAEREAAEARAAEVDAVASDLHARLAAAAHRAALVSSRIPAEPGRTAVLNAAYLVDANAEDRFHAAAEDARAELAGRGVQVTVTGPWPPYSFVEDAS